jgi:hypothetical protein
MGFDKTFVIRIHPSCLASAEDVITFHLAQEQELRLIIQVSSKEVFSKITKLKTEHDMWIYLRPGYMHESTVSYNFAHRSSIRIDHGINPAMVLPLEFISPLETECNRIAHLSQSFARQLLYVT